MLVTKAKKLKKIFFKIYGAKRPLAEKSHFSEPFFWVKNRKIQEGGGRTAILLQKT